MKKLFYSFSMFFALGALFAQSDVVGVVGHSPEKIDAKNLQYINSSNAALQSELFSFTNKAKLPSQIAALAFNQDRTQLVFMELASEDIYAYNLRTKRISLIKKGDKLTKCSLGMQFVRMTLAPNGNIYAINNNATSVIEISEINGMFATRDLGHLTDVSTNNESLLEKHSGWGGDMVADADGTLYIISARGLVFDVQLDKMTTSYVGAISQLEKGYTTNGAAVDKEGNILLGNALGKGFYSIDIKNLQAKKISDTAAPIYDLASPYFLNDELASEVLAPAYTLYPTKVRDRQITVSATDRKLSGKGKLMVLDISGAQQFVQDVNLADDKFTVTLGSLRSAGFYIVKIIDSQKNEVHSEKIIVVK